jgi:hypothetical protein
MSQYQKKEPTDPPWHSDEFYALLSKLESGKIYSYVNEDLVPEHNYFKYICEPGGINASIKGLYHMHPRILTDQKGKQATTKESLELKLSTMSPEEYKEKDVEYERFIERQASVDLPPLPPVA